eukprot:CAMPEP_0197516172 /NCGR_PEP_ID=MMETSP1318-20131121/1027_1 /TAXON_ID=552666 /ORGANISM="Partenskyella glossopodia, Strain RCC365" /LENGTH=395 /DNA_ID=CAMNT_0043064695 /DNA_START=260 /DNA_END=1447 /DNA_ORIENTATION=-
MELSQSMHTVLQSKDLRARRKRVEFQPSHKTGKTLGLSYSNRIIIEIGFKSQAAQKRVRTEWVIEEVGGRIVLTDAEIKEQLDLCSKGNRPFVVSFIKPQSLQSTKTSLLLKRQKSKLLHPTLQKSSKLMLASGRDLSTEASTATSEITAKTEISVSETRPEKGSFRRHGHKRIVSFDISAENTPRSKSMNSPVSWNSVSRIHFLPRINSNSTLTEAESTEAKDENKNQQQYNQVEIHHSTFKKPKPKTPPYKQSSVARVPKNSKQIITKPLLPKLPEKDLERTLTKTSTNLSTTTIESLPQKQVHDHVSGLSEEERTGNAEEVTEATTCLEEVKLEAPTSPSISLCEMDRSQSVSRSGFGSLRESPEKDNSCKRSSDATVANDGDDADHVMLCT